MRLNNSVRKKFLSFWALINIDFVDEGNEELLILIKTHNPHLVVCGGTEHFTGMVGKILIVNPKSLTEKEGAFIDLKERKSEQIKL